MRAYAVALGCAVVVWAVLHRYAEREWPWQTLRYRAVGRRLARDVDEYVAIMARTAEDEAG